MCFVFLKGSPPSVFRRTTSEGPLQKLAVTSSSSTSNLWAYELRKLGETPCPALDGKAMESWVGLRPVFGLVFCIFVVITDFFREVF